MIQTYEAVYEDGVIRLTNHIRLPEHTKVYVIVPEEITTPIYRVGSPRLVDPSQAADFIKEVVEEGFDGPLR